MWAPAEGGVPAACARCAGQLHTHGLGVCTEPSPLPRRCPRRTVELRRHGVSVMGIRRSHAPLETACHTRKGRKGNSSGTQSALCLMVTCSHALRSCADSLHPAVGLSVTLVLPNASRSAPCCLVLFRVRDAACAPGRTACT
eukprot:scaffold12729_cov114-Isochrysis_galbana.AAC.8